MRAPYAASHERERKAAVELLLARSPGEEAAEAEVLERAKKIEAARKAEAQRAAAAAQAELLGQDVIMGLGGVGTVVIFAAMMLTATPPRVVITTWL